jgi:hypothetical protein
VPSSSQGGSRVGTVTSALQSQSKTRTRSRTPIPSPYRTHPPNRIQNRTWYMRSNRWRLILLPPRRLRLVPVSRSLLVHKLVKSHESLGQVPVSKHLGNHHQGRLQGSKAQWQPRSHLRPQPWPLHQCLSSTTRPM